MLPFFQPRRKKVSLLKTGLTKQLLQDLAFEEGRRNKRTRGIEYSLMVKEMASSSLLYLVSLELKQHTHIVRVKAEANEK